MYVPTVPLQVRSANIIRIHIVIILIKEKKALLLVRVLVLLHSARCEASRRQILSVTNNKQQRERERVFYTAHRDDWFFYFQVLATRTF